MNGKMTFQQIHDLADKRCPKCKGLGVRSEDGKTAIATDELLESPLLDPSGKPYSKGRVYMVCPCVRKNLSMKRRQQHNRRN